MRSHSRGCDRARGFATRHRRAPRDKAPLPQPVTRSGAPPVRSTAPRSGFARRALLDRRGRHEREQGPRRGGAACGGPARSSNAVPWAHQTEHVEGAQQLYPLPFVNAGRCSVTLLLLSEDQTRLFTLIKAAGWAYLSSYLFVVYLPQP